MGQTAAVLAAGPRLTVSWLVSTIWNMPRGAIAFHSDFKFSIFAAIRGEG